MHATVGHQHDRGKEGMKGNTGTVTGTGKPLGNATDLGRSYNFSHINML